MAVNNLNFGAQVDDWVRATEDRLLRVFRESTQRVVSLANNGVPVDTGFARASVLASLESMPPIVSGKEKGPINLAAFGEVTLVIAGAQLGQTIYVGWTAAYVMALEYGHSKQAPSGFVRLAAAQWQITVDRVSQEARQRASQQ